MSVCTRSEHTFETLLRIAATSVSHPATFAVPVDAHDEPEFLTIDFDVTGNNAGAIEVVADDRSIRLHEPYGPTRICWIPCAVDSASLTATRGAGSLRVRLRKKGEAIDLPPAGLPTRTARAEPAL